MNGERFAMQKNWQKNNQKTSCYINIATCKTRLPMPVTLGPVDLAKDWDIIWKSRGGRVVNWVLRKVPRPKPEGRQAPSVFAAGLLQGTPFTPLHPRRFHIMSFFGHPGLVKRDFFHCCQTQSYVVEVQTSVKLNSNILVRHFQAMTCLRGIESCGEKKSMMYKDSNFPAGWQRKGSTCKTGGGVSACKDELLPFWPFLLPARCRHVCKCEEGRGATRFCRAGEMSALSRGGGGEGGK